MQSNSLLVLTIIMLLVLKQINQKDVYICTTCITTVDSIHKFMQAHVHVHVYEKPPVRSKSFITLAIVLYLIYQLKTLYTVMNKINLPSYVSCADLRVCVCVWSMEIPPPPRQNQISKMCHYNYFFLQFIKQTISWNDNLFDIYSLTQIVYRTWNIVSVKINIKQNIIMKYRQRVTKIIHQNINLL